MAEFLVSLGAAVVSVMASLWLVAMRIPGLGSVLRSFKDVLGEVDDQSILSLLYIFSKYRNTDFVAFMKGHHASNVRSKETGDYVPGVCNYYRLMADVITAASGPFWHFVPMTPGLSRKECHDKFHHTVVKFLGAQEGEKILEFGCGFGECGRQVAKISGANVTGLTMADEEIEGGNERIKAAGLEGLCRMVQGNYHSMPFEDGSFDRVFGLYTLKYSSDLDKAIAEFTRVLKPGGRLLSYEIIVTDTYDPDNKEHRYYVDNISSSTCMPPLWPAQAFRDAASKAGLRVVEETDLCAPPEGQWYSCFERTRAHDFLMSKSVRYLVGLAETLRIMPKGFSEFYDNCLIHPATDFVLAGRLNIVTGSVMMTWEKP